MDKLLETIDLKQIVTRLVEFLPQLGIGILIMVGFVVLYRATRSALSGVLRRAGFHETLIQLMDNIYRYSLITVGLVMAVDQLGVDVGAALAGIGIAGIALGFAAQDSVANVISGILIFWDKPFEVGDWVRTQGEFGRITDITLRSTRIRTPRNTYVVIPNKNIIDAMLENFSKHGELRIDVPLGIAYKEDVRQARRVLLDAVNRLDEVLAQPPADVVVEELGDSSVNLRVRVWVDNARLQQPIFFKVMEVSKIALDEAGIEIPFPHLQLFFEDVRRRVWDGADAFVQRAKGA